jgi:hypothetical protein
MRVAVKGGGNGLGDGNRNGYEEGARTVKDGLASRDVSRTGGGADDTFDAGLEALGVVFGAEARGGDADLPRVSRWRAWLSPGKRTHVQLVEGAAVAGSFALGV